ncbi:MAG TPA: DUF5667 domain-containing protein [Candidatus Paceibacterota bacterium]|nr:DUF5667 domain-containing protein [Candidatus Paceibacterota bacterium]
MPIIVLIILALTGGVGYASKSALPGDALYSVKTSVTEPVEEALAFGPKAESAVYVSHALERLREIEQLKSLGKLDGKTQEFTKSAFESEISKVNAAILALNNTSDFKDARSVAKTLSDNLKQNSSLSILYGALPLSGSAQGEHADILPAEKGQKGTILNVQSPTGISQTPETPAPTTIQSTTTKYVPKLLPQRANISRDDDDDEWEDDD